MQDYPENPMSNQQADPATAGCFIGFVLLSFVIVVLSCCLYNNVETVVVWVPAHYAEVPDMMRPNIVGDIITYPHTQRVYVEGCYQKEWRWK